MASKKKGVSTKVWNKRGGVTFSFVSAGRLGVLTKKKRVHNYSSPISLRKNSEMKNISKIKGWKKVGRMFFFPLPDNHSLSIYKTITYLHNHSFSFFLIGIKFSWMNIFGGFYSGLQSIGDF